MWAALIRSAVIVTAQETEATTEYLYHRGEASDRS